MIVRSNLLALLLTFLLIGQSNVVAYCAPLPSDTSNHTVHTAKPAIIKISVIVDRPPYSFVGSDGHIQGILVEYWRLWAKENGHKVQFITGNRSQSLQLFEDGAADFHGGLYKNKNQQRSFELIDSIFITTAKLYVARSSQLNNIADLSGKKIGIILDHPFDKDITERFPTTTIRRYDTFKKLMSALNNKEIDAFVNDSLSTWFELVKILQHQHYRPILDFDLQKQLYVAVPLRNKEMQAIVAHGMDNLSKRAVSDIVTTWGISEHRLLLPQATWSKSTHTVTLSTEEKKWIENNTQIQFMSSSARPPYFYINDEGKHIGFNVDLIALINQKLGSQFKIKKHSSWALALDAAKNEKISGIFSLSKSEARKKWFDYSPAYLYSPHFIVVKKDNTDIQDETDLNGNRIAIFKGNILMDVLRDRGISGQFVYTNNSAQALSAVVNNTADATVLDNPNIKMLKTMGLKVAHQFLSASGEVFIGTTKKQPMLGKVIEKAMTAILMDDIDYLLQKWIAPLGYQSIFSTKENRYIAKHPTLIVGIDSRRPMLFSDKDDVLDGIIGDLVKLVAKQAGFNVKVVHDSRSNLLQGLLSHNIDLIPDAQYQNDIVKIARYGTSYLNLLPQIYVRKENISITKQSDLTGKNLAIINGENTLKFTSSYLSNMQLVTATGTHDALTMLKDGKVDAILDTSLVMSNIIKNRKDINVRAITGTEFKERSLHFLSHSDNQLLHSILQKSLAKLDPSTIDSIVNNWLGQVKDKRSLNIAMGQGEAPYTSNKTYIKGIEYDLLKRIFQRGNYDFNRVRTFTLPALEHALNNYQEIDVAVAIKEKNDGYFYSDDFITFNDVIVSLKRNTADIKTISQLSKYRVVGYHGAFKHLGKKYYKLFNHSNRTLDYQEMLTQSDQVKALLLGETDFIVLDSNVFKWHVNKAGYHSLKDFNFWHILPPPTVKKVAFRNKLLRDDFNKQLNAIKVSGEYQHIIDSYLTGSINDKLDTASLIATILSKSIIAHDISSLRALISRLSILSHIIKIVAYNNDGHLLYETISNDAKFYTQVDSYNLLAPMTSKVGFVRVFFDEKKLKIAIARKSLLPDISFFYTSTHFANINEIYQRLDYLNIKLNFTEQEKEYLANHTILKYSENIWQPFSTLRHGNLQSYMGDYLEIISKKSGLKIEYAHHDSWHEIKEAFASQQLDLTTEIKTIPNKNLQKSSVAPDEWGKFEMAIVTKNQFHSLTGLNDLKGKSITVLESFSSHAFIKDLHPEIVILPSHSTQSAFNLVNSGKVDAFVGHIALAEYQLYKNFRQLKVVAISNHSYKHRFMVQDSNAILQSIIDKTLRSITQEEHLSIRNRWLKKNVQSVVDYGVIYQILLVFVVILVVIFIVFKKLSRAKTQIETTVNRLHDTVVALEEQKHVFETLFYDTSDGLILMIDQMFIDCNRAAQTILGFDSKSQLLNASLLGISPTTQPDNLMSITKWREFETTCDKEGHCRFEWVFKRDSETDIWVEIVLTNIKLNNQQLTHAVLRDIADKKNLERQILSRNQELEKSNEEQARSFSNLKKAQSRLVASEKLASLGGLVAGIAHEINTPVGIGLTAITHFVEITGVLEKKFLEKRMSEQDFVKYLDESSQAASIINRNLERTADLVRSFKQISVDQSSDERRTFNLREYIDEILLSIYHITKKSKITVAVECSDTLVLNSFPGAISQILSNLLINSTIHAYPNNETGKISIVIQANDNELILVYEDDGRGIASDILPKIFDPFFTTNREFGGSGLGLNIIYNIVTNNLNGRIDCQSKVGVGTRFTIVFTTPIVVG